MENLTPAASTNRPAIAQADSHGLPTVQLPTPLTSFIGREREVADVTDLLEREDVRLLTLTGAGGVGKTRLAIASASRIARTYPDGTCFVSLAPVADDRLVVTVIAHALGLPEPGDQPMVERLKAWLRPQKILLVLDNFEHLLEAAPVVADLLNATPHLCVLCTSRIRLNLTGEHVYPLTAMEPDAATSLFEQRARALDPSFALTRATAPVVVTICRRLDGLPLAIELAAAMTHVLSPEEMLAQIDRRRALPASGLRDQLARHRTMRDTIAWSYELMTASEQAMFRWLSIFAGGFTLDMAEKMVSAIGYGPIDVLSTVASLVNQSLLHAATSGGNQSRFAMLETFREFGTMELERLNEMDRARRAHAVAVLAMVEELLPGGVEPVPDGNLRRLQQDLDNVRAALTWSDVAGDRLFRLRLARRLFVFWWLGGHLSEGRDWLKRSLTDLPPSPPLLSESLSVLGLLQHYLGEDDDATASLESALAMASPDDAAWIEPLALRMLGEIAIRKGQYGEAQRLIASSLSIFESVDPTQMPETLRQLAIVAFERGDLLRAAEVAEQALRWARETKDTQFIESALDTISLIACARDDVATAREALVEALDQAEVLGDLTGLPSLFADVAVVALRIGATEQSARLFGAADAHRSAIGLAFTFPGQPIYQESIDALMVTLGAASFSAAWEDGAGMNLDQALIEARALLSDLTPQEQAGPGRIKRQARIESLTHRELEVLRLLAEGRSNQSIADALSISVRTVGNHVFHILAKLELDSRTAAAAFAIRHDLA